MSALHCLSAPPSSHILPDGTDSKKIAVLTRDDWNRLHYQLNKKAIERQRIENEKAEKLAMRDESKAMIKTWTNTLQFDPEAGGSRKSMPNVLAIQGARKKRLEERQKRLEAKEAEAKLVDIDEARYQAEKRREAIAKAKQLLYYQTDRVKEFHSALRLTEVLKERDAQLEMKRLRELGMGERDKEWHELAIKQKEEWEKQEAEKRERMRLAAIANTNDIVKQVHEKQSVRQKDDHLERQEGERLRLLAEENARETEEKNRIIREQRLKNMRDNLKQMEERQMLFEKERRQNEADDDECRQYVNAKKNMLRRRAEREAQIDADKRDVRDRIYNKLTALHKARVDDEQERFDKANAERDAREAQEAEDRKRRNAEAIAAAAEHRREQMRRLEEARAENKRREDELAMLQREADILYSKNEEEKSRRRREKAAALANQYLRDSEEKKRVMLEERQRAIGEALLNMELQLHEEDMFQKYAKSVIDNLESRGRNTIPLKRVAAKKPPIVIPSNLLEAEVDDGRPAPPSTYKRLGFVYSGAS